MAPFFRNTLTFKLVCKKLSSLCLWVINQRVMFYASHWSWSSETTRLLASFMTAISYRWSLWARDLWVVCTCWCLLASLCEILKALHQVNLMPLFKKPSFRCFFSRKTFTFAGWTVKTRRGPCWKYMDKIESWKGPRASQCLLKRRH